VLKINFEGARVTLDLLHSIRDGHPVGDNQVEEVLAANEFLIDFYSQWEGNIRETFKDTVRNFDQPDHCPEGLLATRLAEGFNLAVAEMDLLEDRMSWLAAVDASHIVEQVLSYLPRNTPLDTVIHITVDYFNNAFVYKNEIGVSLLKGATDRKTFVDAVTHELHHIGVRFWFAQDDLQQAILEQKTGRSVAILHVQNLLMEGLANFYCTPGYVFRESPDTPPTDPYQGRLARLSQEERSFFAQAEAILAQALKPDAQYEPCWEAFKTVAFDLEDAMLPAGHYLGARMVQTMERFHPRSRILNCIKHLSEFLPLYNEAARKDDAFVFDTPLTEQFVQLWDIK
jgi:hypothetical protein